MLPDIWPSNNSTNFLFLRKLEKSGFFSIWPNWKRLFLSNRVNVCQSACFKPMQTHFTCNKDASWTGWGVFHPHCWHLTRTIKPHFKRIKYAYKHIFTAFATRSIYVKSHLPTQPLPLTVWPCLSLHWLQRLPTTFFPPLRPLRLGHWPFSVAHSSPVLPVSSQSHLTQPSLNTGAPENV